MPGIFFVFFVLHLDQALQTGAEVKLDGGKQGKADPSRMQDGPLSNEELAWLRLSNGSPCALPLVATFSSLDKTLIIKVMQL